MLLGIDIGTTKVAAAIVADGGRLRAHASLPHEADLSSESSDVHEQDPKRLIEAVFQAVAELPDDLRGQVTGVGVTGQMHGVMVLDGELTPLTPLITWRDRRSDRGGFAADLARRTGHRLAGGNGCATLAWLTAEGKLPDRAATAATIADWCAARLCGAGRIRMDPTNAAAWGLYQVVRGKWDAGALEIAGLDIDLLPELVPTGTRLDGLDREIAGRTGVPEGASLFAGVGDNQASLLATLDDPVRDVALTLGTGGQLSVVLPDGYDLSGVGEETFDIRPYVGERFCAVAASFSGGAAWACLADAVGGWLGELDLDAPPRKELYDRLNALGLGSEASLTVEPHFMGQRYQPKLRGRIGGIDTKNFTLAALSRGLAEGICRALRDMLPAEMLEDRTRLVGSGNALRHNEMLRRAAEEVFELPLALSPGVEEAARGAACLAGRGSA